MSALAPTLEAFLADRLMIQRGASPNTIASYRDAFRLLLRFAAERTGKRPSDLDFSDLDARLIGTFLEHLEVVRHNSVRTRNNRLAAIHSLFGYAALRHPEHAATIQRVLAIPVKLSSRNLVTYLDDDEVDALLGACDLGTWTGRRDQALLDVAVEAGLRISEVAALTCADVSLGSGANLHVVGKGRKERRVPLGRETVGVLRTWLAERGADPTGPLFPTITGRHMSRDAIERRVALYVERAAIGCPSLKHKEVSAHTLRHTCAMRLRSRGVALEIIALILGHEQVTTTYGFYLHADMGAAEQAIALVAPPGTTPGRYRAPDPLLAFLEAL
ncbi:MAG: tyrosine-type recombinase/integrase [Actinomycetota bacterium]|jgi:site-specific recombinase XerD|nr:tyrosine-type recombinase/integrase [Actinomycetota bacterium]